MLMAASKPCHNCRKRRLRCDRSWPTCNKCRALGQECLGYGKLFNWTNAVASRGRMAGKQTFALTEHKVGETGKAHDCSAEQESVVVRQKEQGAVSLRVTDAVGATLSMLADPLFQHMDSFSRFCLNYFSERICKELVLHDSAQLSGNPFRQLIAMSTAYPLLQHILVASSAMHLSNNLRRKGSMFHHSRTAVDATVHALHARQKAIKGLQAMIDRQAVSGGDCIHSDENDALLATILFFINFDLIDSGKGGWRAHMAAARALVGAQAASYASITGNNKDSPPGHALPMNELRNNKPLTLYPPPRPSPHDGIGISHYLASDSVVYYIWGGTLDCLSKPGGRGSAHAQADIGGIARILARTEANSYHSCPSQLLLLILRTSRLTREVYAGGPNTEPTSEQLDAFVDLLKEAQSFDPEAWAVDISLRNAQVVRPDELEVRFRAYAAATYRATTCLYLLQAVPGLRQHIRERALTAGQPEDLPFLPTTSDLAGTILQKLSLIPNSSPLFRYSVWPLFITGVEVPTRETRAWITGRLDAMWDLCPWGMMHSAAETLREIWKWRDGVESAGGRLVEGEENTDEPGASNNIISLARLRSMGIEFLAV